MAETGHEPVERDEKTGTETTGHEWDGIRELNSPLPRWWLWTFYATIVWALGYTIAYPAWPMISQATGGILGYSSRMELAAEIDAVAEANKPLEARILAASFEEIRAGETLDRFARAGGQAIFSTYCAQCHGSGAAGALHRYPNLRDDDWLWGGTPDAIHDTIAHGIRWSDDEETRFSEMPAFGDDGLLTAEEISAVADHVLSLSGKAESTDEAATLFADNCAGCHGEDGTGDPELGAPDLADAIWLYGSEPEVVRATITHARNGVMPAWNTRLSEAQIKQVAYYVHSLGGGQ